MRAEIRRFWAKGHCLVASGTADPLPLRFSRQGRFLAGLLAEPDTEVTGVLPAHAERGLLIVVGIVTETHVILPLLIEYAGVVIRLKGEEELVSDLIFR